MSKLERWMRDGLYLPPVMRDFHDQKDIFKTVHDAIDVEKHDYAKEVNWIVGQCYVIDIFLWFMAKRGYTLQRSRSRLPFRDLHEDVAASRQKYTSGIAAILDNARANQEKTDAS